MKNLFFYAVVSVFTVMIAQSAVAQANPNNKDAINQEAQTSAFSQYPKLIDEDDGVVVYGNSDSLFKPYTGPELATEPTDDIQRKRYGILQLSPSLNIYLDYVSDPMGGTYEFINVKNNKTIGQFADPYKITESLYINGSGQLYVYANPVGMCWGKTTYKYTLQNDVLVKVAQPFYYANVKSTTFQNVDLLLAPLANSTKVASLQTGTEVNIIGVTYDKNDDTPWFLTKTPLGLIGWVHSFNKDVMVFDITQCN